MKEKQIFKLKIKKKLFAKKVKALTLTELLVVMVIIGILTLLAVNNFTDLIGDSRAQEAKINLGKVATFQQIYHYEHAKYADDVSKLTSFTQDKLANEEGGIAHYRITIKEASNTSFIAEAEAVTDFDQDGVFNKWTIDQAKSLIEVVPD